MNTYRKLQNGDWGVMCADTQEPGDTVLVQLKDGSTKHVTLGEQVDSWGDYAIFAIPRKNGHQNGYARQNGHARPQSFQPQQRQPMGGDYNKPLCDLIRSQSEDIRNLSLALHILARASTGADGRLPAMPEADEQFVHNMLAWTKKGSKE